MKRGCLETERVVRLLGFIKDKALTEIRQRLVLLNGPIIS